MTYRDELGGIGFAPAAHVQVLVDVLESLKLEIGSIAVNKCGDVGIATNAPDDLRVICVPCQSIDEATRLLGCIVRRMTAAQYADVGPAMLVARNTPKGKPLGLMIFMKAIGRAAMN